ncbi:MerR family transcriptional regulator [Limibaculum sp. M0105]|uniref:MerR family transcriptional regulator n=1 Tax=Thermohalobaculum xanthum TaxID=2753746 RepID=A0A8J7SDF5_9RHOB|nr:MerR family transcriptional regulator [Thermohalobaculum xanthum]MBK0398397.1 MerR family transcriptional regulator [Thermohalobaculum xanthum]
MSNLPAPQQGSTGKSPEAFRTISEVADELDLPQHVLRFWETRFSQIRPLKRGGGRRLYRPDHVALLRGIKALLYGDGMTIKGVQKVLREQGVKAVIARGKAEADGTPLVPSLPEDTPARLASLKARLGAAQPAASEGGQQAATPADRIRASIERLESVLERLERR